MSITGADLHAEAEGLQSRYENGLQGREETTQCIESILGSFHLAKDAKASDYNSIAAIYREMIDPKK